MRKWLNGVPLSWALFQCEIFTADNGDETVINMNIVAVGILRRVVVLTCICDREDIHQDDVYF